MCRKNKNKKKKVIVIFGTRPEAIKMAPVIKELKACPECFKTITCVTAQHRQMLDDVLRLFNIKADYDLNIMKKNQSLFDISSRGLACVRQVLEKEKPDIMLIQGDTSTTFIASLAAFYLKIPIAHIEAGLRTNDKHNPFPEEINRRLTSGLADLHFAPTKRAADNLFSENYLKDSVFLTGNTVVDALLHILEKSKKPAKDSGFLDFKEDKIILVTAHRRENLGRPLKNICQAVKRIVERNKDVRAVYPVHLNPNVDGPVRDILGKTDRVTLTAPLDYFKFVSLMDKSYFILTDSGGVQEEAASLSKPVLIMREKTERQEAVEAGFALLVGDSVDNIVSKSEMLLNDKNIYQKMSKSKNPFGDGKAARRIVEILKKQLGS